MQRMKGAPHLQGVNASSAAAAAVKEEQQVDSSTAAVAATAASVPPTSTSAAGVISTAANQQLQQLQQSTPNSSDDQYAAKVFVGGLSSRVSSTMLRDYFSLFGTVTKVIILTDPITKRSRGYGFVTFSDPETVEKVLSVPVHIVNEEKIEVKHAMPHQQRPTNLNRKIFVGGVSQDTSSEELKTYFSKFGKVEECMLPKCHIAPHRHRGFGYVTFESGDVSKLVCDIRFHSINKSNVECKKAVPKRSTSELLRMMTPTSEAIAQAAAAVVEAQNAAAVGYGYPGLAAYRYAPYPVTAPTAAPQAPPAAEHPLTTAAVNTYPGYLSTNVDMSSFLQGVDLSYMYDPNINH
ncbi:hypothetical protein LSTR_LSTR015293 [Laodelphax striatellus]|uniref:RRM domain-containing protein n=1 Tax=Laodelphax striatellus TaxID=195883 RepID=A0A482WTJ4_LAOST|nr:hypothetical protein LSTR_LSTR015293 [Laodelphax striatellus]